MFAAVAYIVNLKDPSYALGTSILSMWAIAYTGLCVVSNRVPSTIDSRIPR